MGTNHVSNLYISMQIAYYLLKAAQRQCRGKVKQKSTETGSGALGEYRIDIKCWVDIIIVIVKYSVHLIYDWGWLLLINFQAMLILAEELVCLKVLISETTYWFK